uniref:ABC transporter domain-containing protein n=1 Tax=Clastoptera arizonana TaxID=38151 RepID=A0A1B6DXP5_9HEMI
MVDMKEPIEGYNNNIYQFKEHHFPKRPALDLSFKDVTFTVQTWNRFKCVSKEILHGVSGEFRSGELTGIMGPSGAGKSTLLNTLAGFSVRGSGGSVLVNGQDRKEVSLEHYLRVSCYIQQDDELRPLLSVRESMMLASHLKLGFSIAYKDRKQQIVDLLTMLGLGIHSNTLTKNLSGGQKKRLSIALELITNPPIIFLDEPTTGLDSSATSSCMALLKDLAREGRTVICTIHQPSALLFEMLDHLYAVAAGKCIYQGPVQNVVPHLKELGLVCPPYHNPADFREIHIDIYYVCLHVHSFFNSFHSLGSISITFMFKLTNIRNALQYYKFINIFYFIDEVLNFK